MIHTHITNNAQAKALIDHLFDTNKFFHPEDKAEDITDKYGSRIFTDSEADALNARIEEIDALDDDGALMEYMAEEMNRIYVQPYIGDSYIHPDPPDKLTAFRHQACFRTLVTLINLHDGIPHGGNGITETDWQNARNLIASLRS